MKIKKLIESIDRGIIILAVISITLLSLSVETTICSFLPAVNFEEMLDGKKVKLGAHVEGDVVYSMGAFASEYSYTKYQDGSRSGNRKSGNYYVIPTAEGYIGLKVRQKEVADMEKLADETYEFMINGTNMTKEFYTEGRVVAMDKELIEYYNEYMVEMGYTEQEIEVMGTPMIIEYVSFRNSQIMTAIGIILLLLTIWLIIRKYNYRASDSPYVNRVSDLP